MRVLEGQSGRTVAKALGTSEPTVSRRLARARVRLQETLFEVFARYSFVEDEWNELERNGLGRNPSKTEDAAFDDAVGEIYATGPSTHIGILAPARRLNIRAADAPRAAASPPTSPNHGHALDRIRRLRAGDRHRRNGPRGGGLARGPGAEDDRGRRRRRLSPPRWRPPTRSAIRHGDDRGPSPSRGKRPHRVLGPPDGAREPRTPPPDRGEALWRRGRGRAPDLARVRLPDRHRSPDPAPRPRRAHGRPREETAWSFSKASPPPSHPRAKARRTTRAWQAEERPAHLQRLRDLVEELRAGGSGARLFVASPRSSKIEEWATRDRTLPRRS